jgi:hypothetical protein
MSYYSNLEEKSKITCQTCKYGTIFAEKKNKNNSLGYFHCAICRFDKCEDCFRAKIS